MAPWGVTICRTADLAAIMASDGTTIPPTRVSIVRLEAGVKAEAVAIERGDGKPIPVPVFPAASPYLA